MEPLAQLRCSDYRFFAFVFIERTQYYSDPLPVPCREGQLHWGKKKKKKKKKSVSSAKSPFCYHQDTYWFQAKSDPVCTLFFTSHPHSFLHYWQVTSCSGWEVCTAKETNRILTWGQCSLSFIKQSKPSFKKYWFNASYWLTLWGKQGMSPHSKTTTPSLWWDETHTSQTIQTYRKVAYTTKAKMN